MRIPLLDLNRQNLALARPLTDAFERVLRSGHFILGPEVQLFEEQIAKMVEAKHAVGVSSGTDAILLALMALDIGPGDEVLCPSFTFFATAGCIARVGAIPIFVDSDAITFNIDPADAAKRITQRTKAIIPVHLFGQSADLDPILALARGHNIAVIEDAAQALGAKYRNRNVGTIGTVGTYSFFPSKNLGGFGDGGMLVTNDDALAERARLLRSHGAKPKYYHRVVGGNFRLDALQAALIAVKIPHCAAYTDARRANARYYAERLASLEKAERIILPRESDYAWSIWNQFTLRIGGGKREAVREQLASLGVSTEIYYPVPMHEQACFGALNYRAEDIPIASRLARESLSIPIFPELTGDERAAVVGALTGVFEKV